MKVTGQQPPRSSEVNNGKARETELKQARQRAGDKEAPERVQREHPALTTHKLREAVRTAADVRADRVAEIRERVESGRYQVDAERLAGNMLRDALHEDIEKP